MFLFGGPEGDSEYQHSKILRLEKQIAAVKRHRWAFFEDWELRVLLDPTARASAAGQAVYAEIEAEHAQRPAPGPMFPP